jgi:hypothetical protein
MEAEGADDDGASCSLLTAPGLFRRILRIETSEIFCCSVGALDEVPKRVLNASSCHVLSAISFLRRNSSTAAAADTC